MKKFVTFRRWRSFSLRSMLLLTTVVAMTVAWHAHHRNRSLREHEIAALLEAGGFTVEFGGALDDPDHTPRFEQPAWRRLLGRLTGDRLVSAVYTEGEIADPIEYSAPQLLAECDRLERLELDRFPLERLDEFSHWQELRKLTITAWDVVDFAALAELQHLESLSVVGAQAELAPLARMTWLKELSLESSDLSNLELLTELKQLRKLDISANRVSDLQILASLPHLEEVDLWVTSVRDITPLGKLTKLTSLRLGSVKVKDFRVLKSFDKLKSLRLPDTRFADLDLIAHMTELEDLDLRHTKINDLGPLAKLNRLRDLDISDNRVSDISPLANLHNLEELSLPWGRITDISPLTKLPRLRELHISGGSIKDADWKAINQAMPKCSVVWTLGGDYWD